METLQASPKNQLADISALHEQSQLLDFYRPKETAPKILLLSDTKDEFKGISLTKESTTARLTHAENVGKAVESMGRRKSNELQLEWMAASHVVMDPGNMRDQLKAS